MCFLYNKGHNLHTWFQFLKSSNTQKEDLGGTQVGNDHVSRTRIKKISITFSKNHSNKLPFLEGKRTKLGLEQETWFDAGFEAGSLTVTILKEKFLNLH